jgi:serine phosphatase RsbU (regulator of sigma subunit)
VEEDDDYQPTIFIAAKAAVPSVEEDVAHYLVVVEGAEPGKRIEIGESPVTIGRDAQQTLVLADAELSRRHVRVSLVDGEVVAEDLASTNGTFIGSERLAKPTRLSHGTVFRLGAQFLKYERRSRQDVQRVLDLDRDLRRANSYVFSLLPAPVKAGSILADWRFVPSAQLGGDAFGYYWLDPGTFVFYLLDVSGHGAGSAMHSVTVLNVLRQRALPNVDFRNPAQVLSSLNAMFPMDSHNNMFFTMWYGVYDTADRMLTYGSAGHHPAYLVPADRDAAQPLGVPALMIGAVPDSAYQNQRATVPGGGTVYLFSDGVFEIVTSDQQRWSLSDFLPLLVEPAVAGSPDVERLYQAVRRAAGPGPLDDDFSLMAVTFP